MARLYEEFERLVENSPFRSEADKKKISEVLFQITRIRYSSNINDLIGLAVNNLNNHFYSIRRQKLPFGYTQELIDFARRLGMAKQDTIEKIRKRIIGYYRGIELIGYLARQLKVCPVFPTSRNQWENDAYLFYNMLPKAMESEKLIFRTKNSLKKESINQVFKSFFEKDYSFCIEHDNFLFFVSPGKRLYITYTIGDLLLISLFYQTVKR
jgi:hypothetical protein